MEHYREDMLHILEEDEDEVQINHRSKSHWHSITKLIMTIWGWIKSILLFPFEIVQKLCIKRRERRRRRYNLLDEMDSEENTDTVGLFEREDEEEPRGKTSIINKSKNMLKWMIGETQRIPPEEKRTEAAKLNYILEKQYGKQHPRFYIGGTFVKARKIARQQKKLLMLYIHAAEHNTTEMFCRDVLFTKGFKKFANKHFIAYAASMETAEGHALTQELYIHAFPSIVILKCRQNRVNRIACIPAKMMTSTTARETMIQQLLHVYEHHGIPLQTEAINTTNTTNINDTTTTTEVEAQNEAFEQALIADQEAERQAAAEEEERLRNVQEQQEQESIREAQISSIREERERARKEFDNEKLSGETSKIQFRFPNGAACTREFNNSAKVQKCYEYVDTLVDIWSPRDDAIWEDYELSTAFPKTVLNPDLTIGEANCANQIIRVVDLKASTM